MKTRKRIWVVVADGTRARFFTPGETLRGLKSAGPIELAAPDGNRYSRDLKSDRPGRNFSSARGGVRHSIEPQHDYHKLEKHKFTVQVAEILDKAVAEDAFDGLVLVAPRRSLGEFRDVLPGRVKARIRHELGKDLTANTPSELWKKLAPAVRSVLLQD
jgi:protein required for attachment to host cells